MFMIITPIYQCRNCKKTYPGTKLEIANIPTDKLVTAARISLGSPEHMFRIGGKVVQMSDLHQCSREEVGIANFLKIRFS